MAADDLLTAPCDSIDYAEAAAFLTSPSGSWAQSRARVADCLMLHNDDLLRLGQTMLEQRHAARSDRRSKPLTRALAWAGEAGRRQRKKAPPEPEAG